MRSWEGGAFSDVKAASGEYLVGTWAEVVKNGKATRTPIEERRAPKVLWMIDGAKWRLSEEGPEMDGRPVRRKNFRADGL